MPPGPDETPPALSAATIPSAGTSLSLQFSEAVEFGAAGNGGWTAALSGGPLTLTYASGAGSSSLSYNLSRTIDRRETGTISYAQPGNGVQDPAGNDLPSGGPMTITNNSSADLLPHPVNSDVDPADGGRLSEGWAIAGSTISQPATTFDPATAERASYKFDVPAAGDYVIVCEVEAPDTASDSFFVSVLAQDGEPTTDHIWAILPATGAGPDTRTVSWWGNGPPAEFDPKVWTLSEGVHEVIFRGREAGAVLHSLRLEPLGGVPPPQPPSTPTGLRVVAQ